jgi:uroporphyrinogen decarboxylase
MQLLPLLVEAGIDVVIGVDPHTWNLAKTKSALAGKVCCWGGINGHLTVEQRTPAEVEVEVADALRALAPGGGFILSPVDNVRDDTPATRANAAALIAAWRRSWGPPPAA